MFALLLTLTLASHDPMIVSTEWLAARAGQPHVIVVEVGDDLSYSKGHIPGARLLRWDKLVVQREGIPNELPTGEQLEKLFTDLGIGDTARVVLYSREPLRATRAWFTLDRLCQGHRVSVLDGGLGKWTAEGRPLSREWPQYEPARLHAVVNSGSMVALDQMRHLVRRRAALGVPLVVIDSRPALSFLGIDPGIGIDRPGHIPDAISVPWTSNLVDGRFRPADELRDMYAKAGISRDAILVTYCRTGIEASLTYFVLRYLGYDVALYDGSYFEWSARETPIVQVIAP